MLGYLVQPFSAPATVQQAEDFVGVEGSLLNIGSNQSPVISSKRIVRNLAVLILT